ncbi:RHS repeat domain-containing protein [Massilia pseudoviolaceinigra]|uniref:RHS repeat domain-containing protein n=1 Tax=Massilia pseudoviolaceinigra TaxID=3057165 RepID=UPI0027968B6C|nr:RHS repeat domain-containing protein [Massilia sp. CCM 9206]MDQ1921464.1 RHS repeat domain-containing protein [Massilia sp. CCM 9206]
MNMKLVWKTISAFLVLSLASAGATPVAPVESPALTIKTQEKRSPENDAIFYTTAKLALQLAQQIERTLVNGKIQSQTRPDGSVGTYLYGHDGRFQGITYADGRALSAICDESGNIKQFWKPDLGEKLFLGRIR